MDQADVHRVDAEHLVGDLSERRLHPLAVAVGANAELQHAVRRQSRAGLFEPRHHRDAPTGVDRSAVGGLLAEDREPEAKAPAIRLAPLLPRANGGTSIAAAARRMHSG